MAAATNLILKWNPHCRGVAELDTTAVGREAGSRTVELGDTRADAAAADIARSTCRHGQYGGAPLDCVSGPHAD